MLYYDTILLIYYYTKCTFFLFHCYTSGFFRRPTPLHLRGLPVAFPHGVQVFAFIPLTYAISAKYTHVYHLGHFYDLKRACTPCLLFRPFSSSYSIYTIYSIYTVSTMYTMIACMPLTDHLCHYTIVAFSQEIPVGSL